MVIGDSEVEYDPNFRLYLQTKLSNPHYKPEIAAQTTLVNFCVTEQGLEDQLLALVVNHERPDLQEQAQQLVTLPSHSGRIVSRSGSTIGTIHHHIDRIGRQFVAETREFSRRHFGRYYVD